VASGQKNFMCYGNLFKSFSVLFHAEMSFCFAALRQSQIKNSCLYFLYEKKVKKQQKGLEDQDSVCTFAAASEEKQTL